MMNVASFIRAHNLTSKQRKDCVLINEVKRYTFLYDRNEMNHKRAKYRQAAWDEIGRKLGMEGIDCMNRWKVLRDRYRREKRDKNRGPRSARLKKWLYYDICTFLDPYLEDIKPFTQELDEVMNQDIDSAEESSQDSLKMEDRSDEKDSSTVDPSVSLNASSSSATLPTISVAPLHNSNLSTASMPPNTFIRIVMPTDQPQTSNTRQASNTRTRTKSVSRSSPRKYVKILPKTTPPSPKTSRNGMHDDEDSLDLSMYKDKQDMDTVDHLMTFMGNTVKQLPFKRQVKICQELTAVFFNIITTEENEDED